MKLAIMHKLLLSSFLALTIASGLTLAKSAYAAQSPAITGLFLPQETPNPRVEPSEPTLPAEESPQPLPTATPTVQASPSPSPTASASPSTTATPRT